MGCFQCSDEQGQTQEGVCRVCLGLGLGLAFQPEGDVFSLTGSAGVLTHSPTVRDRGLTGPPSCVWATQQ